MRREITFLFDIIFAVWLYVTVLRMGYERVN